MNNERKAEIKRAYKETAPRQGIFSITCAATGETWIDASGSIDTIRNRIWFTLGLGSHPNARLQQIWNQEGPDAVEFAIVEVFDADVSGFALDDLKKERRAHWLKQLGAKPYA
jgi:hypothetical protein